jgi:hypothetical protein
MAADARLTIRLQRELLDALAATGALNARSAAAEARLALQELITRTAAAMRDGGARAGASVEATAEQEPERVRA